MTRLQQVLAPLQLIRAYANELRVKGNVRYLEFA